MHSIDLDRKIAWGLLAVGLLASAASSIFGLYNRFWWFDKFLHLEIPFALTLLFGLYGYGAVLSGARRHGAFLVLTIACVGLGIAGMWEIWEWIYDQMVIPNAILGKTDTILDMVMGTVGAVAAGCLCLRAFRMEPYARPERRG